MLPNAVWLWIQLGVETGCYLLSICTHVGFARVDDPFEPYDQ